MTFNATLRTGLIGALLVMGGPFVQAQESFTGWLFSFERMKEVNPVSNATYLRECGDCHLAYQPGLLPARSWDVLLTAEALHDHFGAHAEVDASALNEIRAYALANAADTSYFKRSRKIAVATATGPTPRRITELVYIARTHRNIPAAQIVGNAAVKSLSQCDKCHTQASRGIYDNDTVVIPRLADRP